MAPTPAELLRMAVEASNRQDMDAFVALFDEEAEIHSAWDRALTGDFAHRGHEGVRTWATEAWENVSVRVELESVLEQGPFAIGLGRIRTHGRSGGTALDHEFGAVVRAEAGRITLYEGFFDHGDALIALGEHVKRRSG